MKDMSEEKELKEIEMYCAELHDLGMRGEAKTISEEDSEYEYKKWTDYLKELLASKDEKINSLESRIAELEGRMIQQANMILKKSNEADMERKTAELHCADAVKLESRLTKSEKEKEFQFSSSEQNLKLFEDEVKKSEELRKRLSHLMDVAGKMAGALKDCIEREFDIPMGGYNYGCGCSEYRGEFKHTCEAKLALAEWDGIKDGGGK